VKIKFASFFLLVFLFVGGCANHYLTYHTIPEGAVISYQDGSQVLGVSPVRVVYVWDKNFVDGKGDFKTKGVVARWGSGAQAASPGIVTIFKRNRESQYTLARPHSAPGLNIDLNIANEVQRIQIAQRQAHQNEIQTNLQLLQLINSMQPPQPQTTQGTIFLPNGEAAIFQSTTR